MNRNFKNLMLTATAIMAIGTAGVSFAATQPAASTAPEAVKTKSTTTTTVATKKAPKVSQDQATQIAVKAHQGATVSSINLNGKVYIVKLTSSSGNYKMKIGANTGRIISDKTIKTGVAKTAPATKK